MKYDLADYAASRLVGTLVRYADTNDLALVADINDEFICSLQKLNGDSDHVHIERLNLKPPRLGYINRNNDCLYLTRVPKRQDWKQGLRYENMLIVNDHNSQSSQYRYSDMVEMVKGNYPSISECFKKVSSGKRIAMAFDYDFGLSFCAEDKGEVCVNLLYGGVGIVGTFNGNVFKLDEQYKYLKERISIYESNTTVRSRKKQGEVGLEIECEGDRLLSTTLISEIRTRFFFEEGWVF